jgi:hypothetical protein
MDQATAERWVTISALTVAGIYAYRRLIEPSTPPATLKKLAGVGELPPLGAWATAWGFTFLAVSVIAEAAPGVGGAFAILIMAGDVLANGASVFADVGKQQQTTTGKQATAGQVQAATVPTIIGATIPLDPVQPAGDSTLPQAPVYVPPASIIPH